MSVPVSHKAEGGGAPQGCTHWPPRSHSKGLAQARLCLGTSPEAGPPPAGAPTREPHPSSSSRRRQAGVCAHKCNKLANTQVQLRGQQHSTQVRKTFWHKPWVGCRGPERSETTGPRRLVYMSAARLYCARKCGRQGRDRN